MRNESQSERPADVNIGIPLYKRRIYHADTDAGGVVHHSRYLVIFEEARTEWISTIEDDDIADFRIGTKAMVVTATEQKYLKPIRLGQVVEVVSRITNLGKVRLAIAYTLWVDGVRCHEAHICLACADVLAGRACAVPRSIRLYGATNFDEPTSPGQLTGSDAPISTV